MLMERLILGCARLTGGASEREAIRLVRTALDAGIKHVDTAPSYGMGMAEAVVGKALREHGGTIAVTAKLGSQPDRYGLAKSYLRRIKRGIGGSRSAPFSSSLENPEAPGQSSGNDFSSAVMRASLDRSHDRLGRIDYLLLHDITRAEIAPDLIGLLSSMAAPLSADPGYASRFEWDAELDAHFGPGMVAQCAYATSWFGGAPPPERRPLFLHGVIKAGGLSRSQLPGFGERLDSAARLVNRSCNDAARIAALYALATETMPSAKLLIASSHLDRLSDVLSAIAAIDRAGTAGEIARTIAAPPIPQSE
jgi:hypothetical protein